MLGFSDRAARTRHDDHLLGLQAVQDGVRAGDAVQAQPQEHACGRRRPARQAAQVLLSPARRLIQAV